MLRKRRLIGVMSSSSNAGVPEAQSFKGNRSARIALLLSLLFATFAAGVLIWRSVGGSKDDLSRLHSRPGFIHDPARSDVYNHTLNELRNLLVPRPNWTIEEATYISDLVKAGYPASVDGARADIGDIEQQTVYNMAVATIAERFTLDGPMDDDARALLRQTLLDELKNPMWGARVMATSSVVDSGLVADPKVRALVERLASDPNPAVSDNARRQLAHYDRVQAQKR